MNKRINALLLALVMVVNMLATAVPAYAVPGSTCTYTVEPDKNEAYRGDTIEFSVYMQQTGTLNAVEFTVEIPEGLTYVANSGTLATDVKSTLNFDDLAWTESSMFFNGFGAGATTGGIAFSGTEKIKLMTFSCTVNDDAEFKSYEVGLIDLVADDSNYDSKNPVSEFATINIVPKPISVTGVEIDETMSLKTGESKNLTVNVTPNGATNKEVTFAVTGDAATVDENGKVTGVKAGTATITVTTVDGGFTDTCVVTVECAHANKTATNEKASDCKDQGWDAYSTCDDCGQLFDEAGSAIAEIPYRELDMTKHTGGTATCKTQAVCTVCGQSYGEVDSNNHEGIAEWTITDTTHKHEYTCCGVVVVEEEVHEYETEEDMICDECEYDRSCKHEDPLTHHEAKPAECDVAGNIEYWECEECHAKFAANDKNASILEDVTIEALGHKYGDKIPEVPAEIGKTGLKAHYQCSECEKYFVDVEHDTYVEKKEVEYDELIIPALLTAIIKVKKTDENGAPLAGAVFTMTSEVDGGQDYTSTESDNNGIAQFTDVVEGSYNITETTAPAGYKLGATREHIDVVNGVAIVYGEGEGFEGGQKAYDNNDPFVFVNEQYKAEFYVTKLDNHDEPLAGAKFKLDGAVDYTAESNDKGIVRFTDVVDGEYVLSETTAPEGYIKSEDTYKFKIENGVVKYWSDREAYVEYGNSISIVNEAEPTTIAVPFTKVVEVIGTGDAPPVEFEFEWKLLREFGVNNNQQATAKIAEEKAVEGVTITLDKIATDGENEYEGEFVIEISEKFELKNKLAFFITEKNTEAANWNYHPETMGYVVEITEAEAGYTVNIYGAYVSDNEVTYIQNVDEISFTNEYVPPVNYTIEIPFKKVVELGGNQAPGKTDFVFKLTPNNSNVEDWKVEGTTVETNVETNGKDTFEGKLVITVAEEDLNALLSEGFTLTEENTGVSNWTYDDTAYLILFEDEPTVASLDEGRTAVDLTGWNMEFKKVVEGEGDQEAYEPAEAIVFTNTYTKNASSGGGSSTPSTPVTPPTLNKEDHIAFMQGYTDGTFGPTKNMTRGEVATMFARLLTEKMDADKTYTNTFTDVPADMWCYNYIGYMQQFGIITGYPDGSFRPEAPITRSEFAAIACRFEELTEGTKTFSDVPETHWAAKYISYAAERGWVTGYTDGTFKPDANITREEVVAVTCRLLERNADADYINTNYEELTKTYSDVEKDDWSFLYIMEASNGHDYTKNDGVETWVDLK